MTTNTDKDTSNLPEENPGTNVVGHDEQSDIEARRASVRQLLTAAGVAGASSMFLKPDWTKPVIGSVVLPAHGQTTTETIPGPPSPGPGPGPGEPPTGPGGPPTGPGGPTAPPPPTGSPPPPTP